MAKKSKGSQPVVMKKEDNLTIRIDPDEIRKKVRRPFAPPTRAHRNKKRYRRREKHHDNK